VSVVVTGLGCLSALGKGVSETRDALYRGVVQPPDPDGPASTVSPPPAVFRVKAALAPPDRPGRTRTSHLALLALEEAVMGTTVGCTLNDEPYYRDVRAGHDPGPEPLQRYLANDLSRVVADRLGARGPAMTVVNACSSGADAVGHGAGWLRRGLCDVAVVGGADALSRYPYLGFAALRNASPERCRPFDLHRKGLNLGEGAAILVLEREEDARRRGAAILARLVAYASASDAFHPTAPHPEGRGLHLAARRALAQARLAPDEIAFVNAHGTATAENDRVEGRVLARLFATVPPVIATKGYTGHTLGAAGALEAAFTVINLADRRIPGCAGFRTPDPECEIVPTATTREIAGGAAMSTSLAFGGTNSVLVLSGGEGA